MSSRGCDLEKQNLDRFDLSKNTSESTQRIDKDTKSDDSNEMVIVSAYDLPRRSYEFVRSLAIAQAHNELVSKLEMIHANHVCKYKEKLLNITPPYRMYSWSKKHFLERRKEHTVWVDVLQKQFSEACLHVVKFKIDIEELLRICKTLFGAFDCEIQQTIESIMPPLEDALDLLKIEHILADELVENLTLMRQCLNSVSSSRASKKTLRDKMNLLKVEDEDFRWNNSIVSRYRVNYSHAQDELAKHHINLQNTKLETTLKEWKKELKYEEYRNQCVLNAYYTDIANFKSRITELTSQYDTQFELVENAIAYKTNSMNKLEMRLLFMNEELTRFRDELRLLEERLLAEQKEQEELRKLEQESAAHEKTKKVKRAVKKKKR